MHELAAPRFERFASGPLQTLPGVSYLISGAKPVPGCILDCPLGLAQCRKKYCQAVRRKVILSKNSFRK
jgi:hypothetical protein